MACLQIYQELLSLATYLRVHSNSKEVSYLSWQNKYPNLKTTCHNKLNFFSWTKLLENLLLVKYFISVVVALRNLGNVFQIKPWSAFLDYLEAQILKNLLLGANHGGTFVGSMYVPVCPPKIWICHCMRQSTQYNSILCLPQQFTSKSELKIPSMKNLIHNWADLKLSATDIDLVEWFLLVYEEINVSSIANTFFLDQLNILRQLFYKH